MSVGLGSLERQPPCVSVDLDKKVAKLSRKYRPGSMVKLVIVGKIQSISYSKPSDPNERGYEGYMRVQTSKMELLESGRNEMAELLDDDE